MILKEGQGCISIRCVCLFRFMLSDRLTVYLKSVKTRIQASSKGKGKDELSMLAVMSQIYKQEGIRGLYRGFGATMLNTFSMRRLFHSHNFV